MHDNEDQLTGASSSSNAAREVHFSTSELESSQDSDYVNYETSYTENLIRNKEFQSFHSDEVSENGDVNNLAQNEETPQQSRIASNESAGNWNVSVTNRQYVFTGNEPIAISKSIARDILLRET